MAETYGELITRLCQLRAAMQATAPGRAALRQVRDELAAMARTQNAAGGGYMGAGRGAGEGPGGAGRGGGGP